MILRTKLTRRGFISMLASVPIVATAAPRIVMPPTGGWLDLRFASDPRRMVTVESWDPDRSYYCRVTAEIANAARVPIEWINPTISPAEQVAAEEYFAHVSDAWTYIDG